MNRVLVLMLAVALVAGCDGGNAEQVDADEDADVVVDTAHDTTDTEDTNADTQLDSAVDSATDTDEDTLDEDVSSLCGNLELEPGEQCDPPGSLVPCTSTCGTSGTGYCREGCLVALPEDCAPPDELCNLQDEDCDGFVDEGTIAAWDRQVVLAAGSGSSASTMDVTATPDGFIAVWVVEPSTDPHEIHAASIDRLGRLVTSDTTLSLSVDEVLGRPAVAWTGSSSLVAWLSPTTGRNVAVVSTNLSVASQVSSASTSPGDSVDLSWTGSRSALAWVEGVSADPETHVVFLGDDGIDLATPVRISSAAGLAAHPNVDAGPSEVAVTWIDSRTGAAEVHLAVLDHLGAETIPDTALTTTGTASHPAISAAHRIVSFVDDRDGTSKAWVLALDASFEPLGPETEISESSSVLLSAGPTSILLAPDLDIWSLEPDGATSGSALSVALGSIDGLQHTDVTSLAAGLDATSGADLLATVLGCSQHQSCSSWTNAPVSLETRTGGDSVSAFVGHDSALEGGFDARPVTYISIQIFAAAPYGGPTTPSGHILNGTSYEECGVCVLMYENCSSTSCEKTYLARGGTLHIDQIGYEGDTFAGRLTDVQLAEVAINPVDRTSTWIEDGTELCFGSYEFDETISGI